MCLLTLVLPGAEVRPDYWRDAADANPDGYGWALNIGADVLRFRSMSFGTAHKTFMQASDQFPRAVGTFHWRWATGGTVTRDNCHPFRWGDDSRLAVAHNGVLPVPATATESDTRRFAAGLARVAPRSLDSVSFMTELGRWASGSKLVVLSAHPDTAERHYIVNESAGHWAEGVWYSNHSYRPYRATSAIPNRWAPTPRKNPVPARLDNPTGPVGFRSGPQDSRSDLWAEHDAAEYRVDTLQAMLARVVDMGQHDAAAVVSEQLADAMAYADRCRDAWLAADLLADADGDRWADADAMDCAVCDCTYLVPVEDPEVVCPDCGACWMCDSASDACRCWDDHRADTVGAWESI
jgi:glutamine amidotransferase